MTALNVLTTEVSAPARVSRIELAELVDARLPGNGGVVWVFQDQDDFWCVRLEGSRTETFATRDKAVAFARTLGEIAGIVSSCRRLTAALPRNSSTLIAAAFGKPEETNAAAGKRVRPGRATLRDRPRGAVGAGKARVGREPNKVLGDWPCGHSFPFRPWSRCSPWHSIC